ncbi:hypothetical protein Tco_0848454 [Tanacetum coccineum]
MGDANPIRTLGDYSKPSHEGYRNTIELSIGNNVVPLRSNTIWTAKLRNDILMFQQHQRGSLSEAWTRFKDLLQKCEIDRAAGRKLRDKNTDESWEIIENFALYDHEDWNDSNGPIKPREEINDRMAKMFRLLKELMTSRAPEKVLIKEETKSPVTKNVNSISLARGEEEKKGNDDMTADDSINETDTKMPIQCSLSRARVGKVKGKTYDLLARGPVYEAILKKKITRKEDIGGNFEIPCNIGSLKHINALIHQGSKVNDMPLSTYMKLTDERPAKTDIRLSLASHSYIYPLGIAEDVLVDVVGHLYPIDFVMLDKKSRKSKISIHMIHESLCKVEKGIKNDIEPIASTMTVNRLVLEWEEKIKLHLEKEMKFDQWRSKIFKGKHPALVELEGEMDDEGEVMLYLTRRSLEVLRKFHWMILGGRFNQLSHVSSLLLSKPGEY